jgi:hypothetical protein
MSGAAALAIRAYGLRYQADARHRAQAHSRSAEGGSAKVIDLVLVQEAGDLSP